MISKDVKDGISTGLQLVITSSVFTKHLIAVLYQNLRNSITEAKIKTRREQNANEKRRDLINRSFEL